jgi:hypothetical protein
MRIIESYFKNKNMTHACICLEKQVVSVCVFFVDPYKHQAEIIALGTSILHQRIGYGSSLIGGLVNEFFVTFGIEFVTVLSDKVAVIFYEKMGFQHFASLENNLCHLFNIKPQKKLSLVLKTELTTRSNKNVNKSKEMFPFFKEKIIQIGNHFKKSPPADTKSEPIPAEVFGLGKRSGISDGNDLHVCEEEIVGSKKIKMAELENENLKKLLKLEQIKKEEAEKIAENERWIREIERKRADFEKSEKERERKRAEFEINKNKALEEEIRQLKESQMSILSGSLKGIFNLKPKQYVPPKQKKGFQTGNDGFGLRK